MQWHNDHAIEVQIKGAAAGRLTLLCPFCERGHFVQFRKMLVELDVLGGAWHFLAMLHSSLLIFSHPKHPNPLSRYKFDRHQVYHVCHVLLLHRIFQCTLRFRRCAIVTYHLQWQCLHSEELIRHLVRMQGWTAKSCAVKAFCSWFPREINLYIYIFKWRD